jgi:hypothetical protein
VEPDARHRLEVVGEEGPVDIAVTPMILSRRREAF